MAVEHEPFAFSQQRTVLINQRAARIDDILRALAKTATAVDIARGRSGALLGHQAPQVVVLANEFVAGGQVEDEVGAGQGQHVAGGRGAPHVFADFDAEEGTAHRAEQLRTGGHQDTVARIANLARTQVLRRGEPTLLIELTVVGQIDLGNHPEQLAALDDGGAVEQQVAHHDGQTDDGNEVELARMVEQGNHRMFASVDEHLLPEEILTSVGRDTQLRKYDNLYAGFLRLPHQGFDLLPVVIAIRHAKGRHGTGNFNKTILHDRTKL